MTKRRTFIKTAGALGAAGATAGCLGSITGGGSAAYGDDRINFYMSPSGPQDLMESQYAPVEAQLEEATGVETNLNYAAGYSAVLQSLGGGSGDIAETGPFAAALGVKEDRCDIALQRFAYGSWEYSSVIVTQEGSDIGSLSDLEGERVAFADRLSASGALFPLFMLKDAGLSIGDLPTDTGDADFTPQFSSHAEAFAALERGQVAAAGVGKFITLNDDRELKDGFEFVETYDGIPRAPVIVSPELSDEEKTELTEALINAPDSMYLGEDGEEGTDDDLWFSDVREASVEKYEPVIDVATELGIEAELLDSA
jgi:phosphonate transport system substrate-binding protein